MMNNTGSSVVNGGWSLDLAFPNDPEQHRRAQQEWRPACVLSISARRVEPWACIWTSRSRPSGSGRLTPDGMQVVDTLQAESSQSADHLDQDWSGGVRGVDYQPRLRIALTSATIGIGYQDALL